MIRQIKLRLSNAYLLLGEKIVIVDSGGPGESAAILEAIRQSGRSPDEVSLILHTHGHSDHAGSTSELQAVLKVPAAVHARDSDMLRNGRNRPLQPTRLSGRLLLGMVDQPFPPFSPDIEFESGFDLQPYGVPGQALPLPGHTRGSAAVFLDDRQVIGGDVLMGGSMGGKLLPGWVRFHYFAEDRAALAESIQMLARYQPTTVHVGHGGPLQGSRVVKFAEKLR